MSAMIEKNQTEVVSQGVDSLKTSRADSIDAAPEHKSNVVNVLVQGVALFSDGYNVQIMGYMNSVLAVL